MRIYALLWAWGWGTLTTLTAAAGILLGGLVVPTALAAVTLFTVSMLNIGRATDWHPSGPRPCTRVHVRTAIADAAKVAVGVGAAAASISLVGVLVVPLLLIATVTSPWFIRLLRSHTPPPAHPHPGESRDGRSWWRTGKRRSSKKRTSTTAETGPHVEVTATDLRAAVEILDDTDLCRGWRGSYTALQLTETTVDRLELVNLRQAYLDEIERRHPAGLRAWLDSGARAAGDPTRYLRTERAHRQSPGQARDHRQAPAGPDVTPIDGEGEPDGSAA